MLDTTVKFFESTQTGAPSVSGTVGSLVTLLDACLVNGYGQVTVSTLSVASDVATLTVSAGHGLTMVGNVGPVILIAGAEPAALNGEWRVASVTNSTTVTVDTTGIADCTATGTITMKRAPAGWTKRYSGTNKAAYARERTGASSALIRIQDDGTPTAYSARIAMYETMTDVDTGVFSGTQGARYIHHSNMANSTAREWRLIADHRVAYLFIKNDGTNWYCTAAFGDLNSYKTNDLYPAFLNTQVSTTTTTNVFYTVLSTSLILRSYTQADGVIGAAGQSHNKLSCFSNAGQAYPSPVDGMFQAWPVELWESTANVARGLAPGLWNPLHAADSIPDGTLITDVPQLAGRTLWCQSCLSSGANGYVCAIDISGPWV